MVSEMPREIVFVVVGNGLGAIWLARVLNGKPLGPLPRTVSHLAMRSESEASADNAANPNQSVSGKTALGAVPERSSSWR